MLGMNRKLAELEKQGNYIKVGLIGAGQMGRGMISQIEGMKGMKVVAAADINITNVIHAYKHAGIHENNIVQTDKEDDAVRAVEEGKVTAFSEAEKVASLPSVDVVVDATGIPNVGAAIAWEAILNRKHIVMLNVEADVTVGPVLKKLADSAGVVYTGSAGDEPGAVMELYDFADALGFEVIALGKGKNNPLNLEADPSTAAEEAKEKGASPKMLASFQDGTKTMVEMNAVANATGFIPDQTGMHGFQASVDELADIFQKKEDGGQLHNKGIVEYVQGVAPGVFAIITSHNEEVHEELQYVKLGSGPHYTLYRPYHLTSLETPLTVARAYFDNEPTIAPNYDRQAETAATAKKDLKKGEFLDSIGGYSVYGTLMEKSEADKTEAFPIGLVDANVKVLRDVQKGETLTYNDIEQTKESTIWRLRRLQEQ
ncbi:NAD(P)H-dependent oxidoreductase [Salibacterium halotolerans]|uniref:Predicted homoserine dehydrogenase, contains C-terminal SAF domain n=1 Tax=Salibacterium halotolerans TaxID=1884432 RepID=A0A1I5TEI4_9BACI|nr:NAD(P)-dependent oxidoreductase [Salibacterium halotolerans]SFP81475.1 Predicted homoserine dehydrogenase, contains C-terminal SAF domain [Salibacterium halotolerans]